MHALLDHEPLPVMSSPGLGKKFVALGSAPRIDGYRINRKLGAGGMGEVWRAIQLSTGQKVALKLINAAHLESKRARKLFKREVRLAARLQHPNIARVYDSGLDHSEHWYAMELVHGLALDKYVRRHRLTQRQVLGLMRVVCEAVQHAHRHKIIHTDLKPSNILVSNDGQPHVLDFGLAKFLQTESLLNTSVSGRAEGTPAFMSPEQAAGGRLDRRTDVFSLGMILYLLLTGCIPSELSGAKPRLAKKTCGKKIPRPREITKSVDRELEAIVLKALADDPRVRYSSAGDLSQDIQNYLNGELVTAEASPFVYIARKCFRKYLFKLCLAHLAGILLLAESAPGLFYREAKRDPYVVYPVDYAEVYAEMGNRVQACAQELSAALDRIPVKGDRRGLDECRRQCAEMKSWITNETSVVSQFKVIDWRTQSVVHFTPWLDDTRRVLDEATAAIEDLSETPDPSSTNGVVTRATIMVSRLAAQADSAKELGRAIKYNQGLQRAEHIEHRKSAIEVAVAIFGVLLATIAYFRLEKVSSAKNDLVTRQV